MQVFLYDDMMYKEKLECLVGCEVLSITPAFASPMMLIDAEINEPSKIKDKSLVKCPVMIDKTALSITRMPCTVFGALVDIDGGMEIFRSLDAFYTCSMAHLGENKPTDLFHRKEIDVKTIRFDNSEDIIRYDYEVEEELRSYAYIGNTAHVMLSKKVLDLKHTKIGSVWRAFFSVFHRQK